MGALSGLSGLSGVSSFCADAVLGQVTNLDATSGQVGQIPLTWDAVAHATGYSVERSADGHASWSVVGTPASNSYTDTGLATGAEWYYRVRATAGGTFGDYSDAAGATTFTPLTLSPVLWLKADAGTFQTVSGTAATADGDPVGSWLDQSGNGNNGSQGTSSKRPTLKLAIQNGLPILRFDGVDDFINVVDANTLDLGDTLTIAGVLTNTGGAATGVFMSKSTNAYGASFQTSKLTVSKAGISNIVKSTSNIDASFHVLEWTKSGATNALYLDGTDVTGVVTNATLANNALDLEIGAEAGITAALFDLGELLIFPTALSTGNRQSVESYLRSRWGTP